MDQETEKQTEKEKGKSSSIQIWQVAIPALAAIIVALFNFPPFVRLFNPEPSPTPSATSSFTPNTSLPSSPISTITSVQTETLSPVESSTPAIIPSTIATPDLPSPTSGAAAIMYVKIIANQTTGRAPLNVRFDARASYVQAPDGRIFECSKGACRYRWSISLGGQAIALPDPSGGTLSFKFQEKGTYVISVNICHGSESPTCGNGYTLVIVN